MLVMLVISQSFVLMWNHKRTLRCTTAYWDTNAARIVASHLDSHASQEGLGDAYDAVVHASCEKGAKAMQLLDVRVDATRSYHGQTLNLLQALVHHHLIILKLRAASC